MGPDVLVFGRIFIRSRVTALYGDSVVAFGMSSLPVSVGTAWFSDEQPDSASVQNQFRNFSFSVSSCGHPDSAAKSRRMRKRPAHP